MTLDDTLAALPVGVFGERALDLDALIDGQEVPPETILPVQLWQGYTT